ncbi:MAG: adenosylcobinamide-GDP ribazoletransferase [Bacillota bacterium]|nr:adenosylcobinamide-GDP ribazoletransferase [Bacillota bacterium]
MKYLRGFMMAWGMFCWIPCPYKKWNEEDRLAQLAMLPLVGACIGAICCLIWWPLANFSCVPTIMGALLTGVYFLLTGFIHLDGFMDCSDAVMPRHPEMEERRRILKDSHVGAFATICLVLMLLIFAAAWISAAWEFDLALAAAFVMICTLSRMTSVVTVMTSKPMSSSQYAEAGEESENAVPITVAILIAAAITVVAMILARNGISVRPVPGPIATAIIAAVTVGIGLLVGLFDRKKLGGMNGDISGHMITTSEMCGMITLALFM